MNSYYTYQDTWASATTSTTSGWTVTPMVVVHEPHPDPIPLSALDRLDASVSEMCKVGREVMA